MSRFDPRQQPTVRDTAREQGRFAQQIKSFRYVQALAPAQVAAQSSSEVTVTVTCSSGDDVMVNGPSQPSGIVLGQAYVSAKNTVKIPFINVKGSGVTPTAGDYKIRVMR